MTETHTIAGGDYDGWTVHVVAGHVQAQTGTPRRGKPLRGLVRDLTRAYPAGAPVWAWLRAQGVTRVSTTSGPSSPTAEAQRGTVAVKLRLAPDVAKALRELAAARRTTVSALVSGLVGCARADD